VQLLKWFTGLGIFGLLMIVMGTIAPTVPRDAFVIAGGIIIGCVAIGVAILAAAKS